MDHGGRQGSGPGAWRFALLAGIAAVVLLLTASGLLIARLSGGESSRRNGDQVQVLDPPRPVAEIALTSGGDSITLTDLRGKPVLLFFGYTHCPDVCPTTLAGFRQIKHELDDGEQVHFVFVSVDGSRDTPDVVHNFVSQFDPDFIGLTGSEDDVRLLGDGFNLYFARAQSNGSASDYLVDHTGYSYLIGPESRLRIIYPYGTASDRIVADLEEMLR